MEHEKIKDAEKTLKSLSVVLPIYNEEGNIAKVIEAVTAFLPAVSDNFEIIAVDDGSRDKSSVILDRLAASKKFLRVVHHSANEGYGSVLRSGFKMAAKDFILLMDADGQFEISELMKLLPWSEQYDIVAGIRKRRRDPFYRVVLGSLFNSMVHMVFGLCICDVDCGFKLFKTDFIRKVDLLSTGGMIHTEIFLNAKKLRVKVKQVEVRHQPRIYGRQKTVRFSSMVNVVSETLALLRERKKR